MSGLKKFGDTLVLHPLNSRYVGIELNKGSKHRIVGKVEKKEKRDYKNTFSKSGMWCLSINCDSDKNSSFSRNQK